MTDQDPRHTVPGQEEDDASGFSLVRIQEMADILVHGTTVGSPDLGSRVPNANPPTCGDGPPRDLYEVRTPLVEADSDPWEGSTDGR